VRGEGERAKRIVGEGGIRGKEQWNFVLMIPQAFMKYEIRKFNESQTG
jgi:hypothetical protein